MIVDPGRCRVGVERPEPSTEGQVRLGVEVLVGYDEHLVVPQSLRDGPDDWQPRRTSPSSTSG